eukprot:14176092-Alexandrium_andersonii.AAC.1
MRLGSFSAQAQKRVSHLVIPSRVLGHELSARNHGSFGGCADTGAASINRGGRIVPDVHELLSEVVKALVGHAEALGVTLLDLVEAG